MPRQLFGAHGRQEDGYGRQADEIEVSRHLCLQEDPGWRAEVQDGVGVDAVAWVRLVKNDDFGKQEYL